MHKTWSSAFDSIYHTHHFFLNHKWPYLLFSFQEIWIEWWYCWFYWPCPRSSQGRPLPTRTSLCYCKKDEGMSRRVGIWCFFCTNIIVIYSQLLCYMYHFNTLFVWVYLVKHNLISLLSSLALCWVPCTFPRRFTLYLPIIWIGWATTGQSSQFLELTLAKEARFILE
jgi:hypothetical protein